jgi:hypothetical protein
MNVLNIEIGTPSITIAPRADGTGQTPPPPPARSAGSPSAASTSSISLTRLAWFDANGDGQIDTRSAGSGGDATLLVPAHQVDLPTYGRAAHPAAANRAPSSGRVDGAAVADRNPAQTQRAVAAYERYGQAPTSVAATPTASADAISVSPGAALAGERAAR